MRKGQFLPFSVLAKALVANDTAAKRRRRKRLRKRQGTGCGGLRSRALLPGRLLPVLPDPLSAPEQRGNRPFLKGLRFKIGAQKLYWYPMPRPTLKAWS